MIELLKTEQFSRLVGLIYDCAIEPARWPAAMEAICTEVGFASSALLTADYLTERLHFLGEWNTPRRYQDLINDKFADQSISMYRQYSAVQPDPDAPLVLSRGPIPPEIFRQNPFHLEWAAPQGFGDALNVIVLNEPQRLGALAAVKWERDGNVTDEQIRAMRLLTPHIRRAIAISNLMDLRTIQADTATAALESFKTGIIIVGTDTTILHANKAAHGMLREGTPIRSAHGRLITLDPASTQELTIAVHLATTDEARLSRSTIGLKLQNGEGSPPCLAHILPIARGRLRTRLMPRASAAVFIANAQASAADITKALGNAFSLTQAEQRVLELILDRANVAEAAQQLGLSPNTVKTHIAKIFDKTGVASQADLVRLGADLVPPFRTPP